MQAKYERHQDKSKHIKLTTEVIDYISEKLKNYCSPQQVVGRLQLDKNIKISTKTAYGFVLQDKAIGAVLYKYLRHQHKKYRKRYGKNDYRAEFLIALISPNARALLTLVLVLAIGG